MAALTIRLPEARRERLRQMTKHRGLGVNKLVEELSTAEGLRILAQLDRAFAGGR